MTVKSIIGYDYNYSIDTQGCVYKDGKILKAFDNGCGYLSVQLRKDGKRLHKYVHRLVWEIFNGPIPKNYEINHIDHNKKNNCLDNLEVVTHQDNINSAKKFYGNKFGLYKNPRTKKINYCSKCGKVISKNAILCRDCSIKFSRKKGYVEITKDKIVDALIKSKSFVGAGKLLCLSDNAVRKQCIKYNLPSSAKELKEWLYLIH